MRLQRILARAGVASRRGSEELIVAGRVTVNGEIVDTLGAKADPVSDRVCVDGVEVRLPDESVTLMLNKPAGYVTTMDDPQGRPCVASLVPIDDYPGLFPLGRLDRDTTGLLLFSTDGELGHALLRPRGEVGKRYLALVEGRPSEKELELLRKGVQLSDGPSLPASIELLEGSAAEEAIDRMELGRKDASGGSRITAPVHGAKVRSEATALIRVEIHEGRKREVRRMFEAIGHPVLALHRESFAGLELGGLARGAWRLLSDEEISKLREAM